MTAISPRGCFPPDRRGACRRHLVSALIGAAVLVCAPVIQASEITLSADRVEGAGFSVRTVRMQLDGSALSGTVGEVAIGERSLRDVRWRCPSLQLAPGLFRCAGGAGSAAGATSWGFDFAYAALQPSLELVLRPAADEAWRVSAGVGARQRLVRLDLQNGAPARFAPFLPKDGVLPRAGRLNGSMVLAGDAAGWRSLDARMAATGVAFADAGGLRAGEKLAGSAEFEAHREAGGWAWRGHLRQSDGEVFWQPVYLPRGARTMTARGRWNDGVLSVDEGTVELPPAGKLALSGVWDAGNKQLRSAEASAQALQLGALYEQLLKPFLTDTALAQAKLEGAADVRWRFNAGATRELDLHLRGAGLSDEAGRFSISKLDADIPWRDDAVREGEFRFQGASLGKIPFGPTAARVRMHGYDFTVPAVTVPLFDGRVRLTDLRGSKTGAGWRWQVAGQVEPLSMERLSQTLGWPRLQGNFSAGIPKIGYADNQLNVEGVLLFRVFDGTILVQNLRLSEPFGRVPRAFFDLDMLKLDLDLLTSAFSFGSMQGRVDLTVHNAELVNWRPVNFDARIASSPGRYPRKISQRAVQNISALGGAGAAAAIQRSFLGFFEQFSYSRLGLSCALRNSVCTMDGVAPAKGGGYVIVEGGGIPAITVIGYNRSVDWQELLDRLKRITGNEVKPVVR